jgi:DNA invertase Pin-like site-specific DNA recombinase
MPNLAIAYLRVSTDDQAKNGAGLDAQRTAIQTAANARSLEIITWHEDAGISGKIDPAKRDGMRAALDELATGPASVLLFAKADRVSRSVHHLSGLLEQAQHEGWTMAAADGSVDITTAQGVAMAQVSGVFAELERKMIGTRTREALAEKRAQGVRLGRPSTLPAEVVARIVREREAGGGWSAIARGLMADNVPTARGGATWHPSAVQKVHQGQDAARLLAGTADASRS